MNRDGPEWHCQNSEEERQHQEELAADWDELQLDVYLGFWKELEKLLEEAKDGYDKLRRK